MNTKTSRPSICKLNRRSVCHCGNKKTDALWVLNIQGEKPLRVHRPCGLAILKGAPKDVKGKVYPSRELKEIHKKEKHGRELSSSFWEYKFAEAKAKSFQDLVKGNIEANS